MMMTRWHIVLFLGLRRGQEGNQEARDEADNRPLHQQDQGEQGIHRCVVVRFFIPGRHTTRILDHLGQADLENIHPL